jgi:hypothetical protein
MHAPVGCDAWKIASEQVVHELPIAIALPFVCLPFALRQWLVSAKAVNRLQSDIPIV